MTTKIKLLVLGLLFSSTILAKAQHSDIELYREVETTIGPTKSTSDKLIKEIEKIIKFTEDLATADESKKRAIKRKITEGQERIILLKDLLSSEKVMIENREPFTKYDFDIADKSLVINKFDAMRNGTTDNFDISFETSNVGKARIDIISPGGELLKSIFISNYKGKASRQIDLSCEKGQVYFIHINIDGKSVTNKVRFS